MYIYIIYIYICIKWVSVLKITLGDMIASQKCSLIIRNKVQCFSFNISPTNMKAKNLVINHHITTLNRVPKKIHSFENYFSSDGGNLFT